jgi:hypothetical protein
VNKDHYARFGLLVGDEHALAEPERRSLEPGIGLQILRPTLFELLVCGGKLAGVNASRAPGSTTTLIALFLL